MSNVPGVGVAVRARLSAAARGVVLAVAAVMLAGCGQQSATADLGAVAQYQAIPERPLAAPPQEVTESNGRTWEYARPAKGRITLLYFGYTSCPDVCPLTMADLAHALRGLPASVRDKIWVQFVSTDPRRDTARQISGWLRAIDPTFHGGRAPIAEVVAAARAYGVFITPPKVTAHDYQVTHGAQLLVLDEHGGEVGYLTELAGASAYARAIPALVARYA